MCSYVSAVAGVRMGGLKGARRFEETGKRSSRERQYVDQVCRANSNLSIICSDEGDIRWRSKPGSGNYRRCEQIAPNYEDPNVSGTNLHDKLRLKLRRGVTYQPTLGWFNVDQAGYSGGASSFAVEGEASGYQSKPGVNQPTCILG